MKRREFLRSSVGMAAAGAGLLGYGGARRWLGDRNQREIPTRILGASHAVGHLLRDSARLPAPSETRRVGTVIVGGGIAGLSSAWWLDRHARHDYALLELEPEAGGNSRFGENSASAYPWGAHYLPLPGPEAEHVRELLAELGVIRGYDAAGVPIYDELALCAAPQERLFIHGEWQDGLLPQSGATARDRAQYSAFFARMEGFKNARGVDGRPAFAVPLECSSRDPALLALDRIPMSRYLADQGWDSPLLHWYVNYCCRDDYGSRIDEVSAWAGIHYFSARRGTASGVSGHPVLTWPEGNGFLARKLREKAGDRIHADQLVTRVAQESGRVHVDTYLVRENRMIRWVADSAIVAAPRFVAARIVEPWRSAARPPAFLGSFGYAPWMVANVTVNSLPRTETGAPLSWDNVFFKSDSLGYVVATHQLPRLQSGRSVLTYYLPLTDQAPGEARAWAQRQTPEHWRARIVADLRIPHPGLEDRIESIDVWLWGHAMIRPVPGFISGEERVQATRSLGDIHFAHSDLSGVSIFEEAQYWGIEAARRALHAPRARRLG